jgi:hypothetical protein
MTASETVGLYLGRTDAEYFKVKEAFTTVTKVVKNLEAVDTLDAARKFLTTRTITVIVVNLHLDRDKTAQIIEEIRRGRPYLKIFAVMPFQEVVAHNCWCVARGLDGTITVDQFRDAISKVRAERRQRALLVTLGIAAVLGIVSVVIFSACPIVKFLGVFWVSTLAAEFGCCVLSHSRRRLGTLSHAE